MQPPAGAWLIPKRGVQSDSDAVKLFCVPQAGMGAWVYQSWSDKLAPEVQVLPVELPGHGTRMRESRITELCTLSSQIVDGLQDRLSCGPYALFGHSMGAWIVWEVLQELTRRSLPLPVHLFASANRAPHLCAAAHDIDSTRMHKLAPADFWAAMKRRYGVNPHLEDPHMQAFMYPMLKDDFTLVETYQVSSGLTDGGVSSPLSCTSLACHNSNSTAEAKTTFFRSAMMQKCNSAAVTNNRINCVALTHQHEARAEFFTLIKKSISCTAVQPSASGTRTTVSITAVGARLDHRYKPEQISAWSQHTTGHFQELWLEDLGHNYVDQAPDALLTAIKAQLLATCREATTAMRQ